MLREPRKLPTENAPLGFTTAIARFFRAKVLAAGDGLGEDDTLVIAQVYAGAQITEGGTEPRDSLTHFLYECGRKPDRKPKGGT